MKNEKSPGPDGLPAEFYKAVFPLFGYQFVNMLNLVFDQFLELYLPPCLSVISRCYVKILTSNSF
jgi:hypothetical protein